MTTRSAEIKEIRCLGDIHAAAMAAATKFGRPAWFRGQPCASDKLRPGIFRDNAPTDSESSILQKFRTDAPTMHSKCPDFDSDKVDLAALVPVCTPTRGRVPLEDACL